MPWWNPSSSDCPARLGGASPPVSQNLAQVLQGAQEEAARLKDEYVSTEHLLLALTKVPSAAQRLLHMHAVREQDVLSALQTVRGSARVTDESPEAKFQALQKYAIDLVERAQRRQTGSGHRA